MDNQPPAPIPVEGETVIYPDGYVAPVAPAPALRHITQLAFRNRFTKAEKVAIEMASLDDPTASVGLRQAAAGLRVALADLNAASYIDLDRPDTRTDVQMLETNGLIGTGRALEILDTIIQDSERPH